MNFGDIEVRHIHGGNFYLDGGAMFGVIPKPLWHKVSPADDRNRIHLAANCLLLRVGNKNVLIETGNGIKWDAKQRNIYGFDDGDPLTSNLRSAGITPDGIDLVINTHLHFDHAGGNTRPGGEQDVPSFPKAEYVVQRKELEHASKPSERDRASYFPDRFSPITQTSQWRLLDGDADILPGISAIKIPGHNEDIQAIKISGGGKTLLFVADLIPTRHHLPLPWIMGYDLYPMQTLETKRQWVSKAAAEGWVVVFGHDPDHPAATLHRQDEKIKFEPVNLNQ